MKRAIAAANKLYIKIRNKCTERLVNKLILLFTSIVILIVVSLTYVSYSIIQNQSVKSNIEGNADNLRLVNNNFESYLADIKMLSLPNLKYQKFMDALINEAEDFTAGWYIEDYLRSLYYSRMDIEGIFLYLIEQDKYYYISRTESDTKVKIVSGSDIRKQNWYIAITSDNPEYVQSYVINKSEWSYPINQNKCFMAYNRAIINISKRKPQAIISFYLNPDVRNAILKDITVNKGEHVLLMDKNDNVLYTDDDNIFQKLNEKEVFNTMKKKKDGNVLNVELDTDNYMAIYNVSDKEGLLLVKVIPFDIINKAAKTNKNLSLFLGCVFLAISIILITFTSNAITKPLKKLSKKMHQFSEGNFDVETRVYGRDEISQLSNQFNLMAKKTNELINEKYKMKLIEKNAILKALEAEINPHFLYNALQAISTKALKSGEYEISNMVDALASTFRYCNKGGDIVTLSDEIKHVENYLVIQQARFGNRLRVNYQLDCNSLNFKIPKLSIQTLVENSVKHALEKISGAITVHIQTQIIDGNVLISVSDDGPGMSEDTLDEVMASLRSQWEDGGSTGIGLKNLNIRLKLIYGEQSNIYINSDNTGTQISFVIPKGDNAE